MHGLEQELRQHAGALRALALRLVGPAHADDLVQETSLLAWAQRPDERGGLGAWLRSVLRHRAGKLQRGEARRARREQTTVRDGEVASPVDVAAQREAMAALHGALMALSAPYQGVLLQRFFQDLTPTAIAQQNGVPVATVKSQLQRGLALLRERLDAGGQRDWRGAFASAFLLPRATPVVVATAGAILMSTKIVWLGGAAVTALLCVVFWPEVGAAPPEVAPIGERVVVAAATPGEATSEALQRHEVIAAAAPAVASPRAPLRIRLVDAFDGAPLPEFWVRLQPWHPFTSVPLSRPQSRPGVEQSPMACSDERGELTIDGAWRDQELEVVAIDDAHDRRVARNASARARVLPAASDRIRAGDWPPAGQRIDVPVAVGPTYRVLFDLAPPEGDLEAVLMAGDNIVHAEWFPRQPWRQRARPWVRFSADNANVSTLGDGPWSLVVFGPDWIAIGAVQQIRGAQATPVLLRGRACGNLRVEMKIDGQTPRAGPWPNATVYALDATGTPVQTDNRTFQAGTSVSLPAGRYRVFVGGPDQQLHREDVAIEAGATVVVRASFRAGAERLTLQVVMRSQTGKRQVGTLPDARRVGGTEFVQGTYLRAENGASLYELVGLLPGEWDVSLDPTPHLPPWDATTKRVSAHAGSVEFVCLDAGAPPPGHGRVRVVDAAKKQPIIGAGVTTLLEGMHYMSQTGADGIMDLGPCLAGQSLPVLVRAGGYAPALLEVVAGDTAESPPHEVALQPGWGTLLIVRQPDPPGHRGKPLPSVRVLVDGVPAGTTDARGFLLLSTAARPARLEFLHDDYVLRSGSVDAATGAPDGQAVSPFFFLMEKKKPK